MKDAELVGKCGLYCGVCAIYRAQRDSPELRQQLAEKYNCSYEEIRCDGCGALTSKCWGFDCYIGSCIGSRHLEMCDECPKFDNRLCDDFEDMAARYAGYGIDLRENMELIREDRIDELIDSTERYFACKSCGKLRAAGLSKCHHCGVEVDIPVF
jgi:hypothetical protein